MAEPSSRPRLLSGGLDDRSHPDVSVVVPALDEESSLGILADRVRDVLDRQGLTWELILVDDGSSDGTPQVVRDLSASDDRIRGRILGSNHGKSAALEVGFRAAQGDIVVTMDADLQDLPEEMPKLLAAISDGSDVVQAWRVERSDTHFKVFASGVFNGMCSLFSGLRLHDVNCGFKAIRRSALRELRLGSDLHRFIPILLHRQGFVVKEVPVLHSRRAFGHSKYGLARYFRGFNDLIGVVLLPRLLTGISPMLPPLGLLFLLGSAVFGVLLLIFTAQQRIGLLFELGLSALAMLASGVLCFALSYLARMGFTSEQADRTWHPDVAERLD